jgi:hypothetical protein
MRTHTTFLTLTLGLAFFASAAATADTARETAPGAVIVSDAELEQPEFQAGDVDHSGSVDVFDFLAVMSSWGACPTKATGEACPADLDGDGLIGVSDLLIVLANWS